MICPKCDRENDAASTFCGICGSALNSYEAYSAVEAPMVGFPRAVGSGIRNIFNFKGRATRAEYWWFILFLTLVGIIPVVGWFIYDIGHITVLIRRLHDVGKSGWWILAPIAPGPLFVLSEYFAWITLALLIYLAVAVKSLQKEVFWDRSIMKPAIGEYYGFAEGKIEMKYNVQELLNNVLKETINNQQGEQ